jgi:D-beta-D-heptose 7-phosphate kinase / D-beta-D-heptose 1-phosphate adenosyltransferase
MSESLNAMLDAFARLDVLVIGDAMLDSYSSGDAARLCPDAPVPVVDLRRRQDFGGGAANVAANLAALGARPTLLSVIGDDGEGALLEQVARDSGVLTTRTIRSPRRKTLVKHRILAGSQVVVRLDHGTAEELDSRDEHALIDALDTFVSQTEAVLISDYGYGTLTPRVLRRLGELLRRFDVILAIDSKNLARFRDLRPIVTKPNYRQACELLADGANAVALSQTEDRGEVIIDRTERLLKVTGARIVAVTLDKDGAVILEKDRQPYRTYARSASAPSPCGAGDTYLASFALTLAAGGATQIAANLASAAAGIVVGKDYTASCTALELREAMAADGRPGLDVEQLCGIVTAYRRQGRRIVLTNGCFDILHGGHISYLRRARTLGDVLIVGVNTDDSIRRLKGPTRPINCLDDRLRVLAALSCVDHLVAFAEDTPHQLIRRLRPDIFVKGGDYTRATLPEAGLVEELGGRVEILPMVADRSTTRLIDRITETHTPNAHSPPRSSGAEHGQRPLGRCQEPVVR